MKKLLALALPALVAAAVLPNDASADVSLTPVGPPSKFFVTNVSGTITVPGAQTGPLAGFGCSNIVVHATSKDHYPGFLGAPKWTRSAHATGTYSSGHCSYGIPVISGSEFFLTLSGWGNFQCQMVLTSTTPPGFGPETVAQGATRTENFKVNSFECFVMPG